MLAVIMAGGKGTRLRPLTCDRPKPMVPVANRPLIEHVIGSLAGAGWREIALTLCYQPDKIQAYCGSGQQYGARLHYFIEEHPLGTAGSVKMASGLFQDTILVGSGDALADFDLGAALAFHKERQALATIILTRVPSPLEYGVVITEPDGRILRFLEKPGWGEVFSDTVNTGFYLLEPEVFELVPKDMSFDFSRDLFPILLAKGERLFGFIADGYWSDVGTIEQYRRTHLDILAGKVRLPLPGRRAAEGIWVGTGAEIDPEAVIEGPALIGDYCRIERGAHIGSFSILGDHSLVAAGASLKRSILWRHAYLGRRAEVRGAILCDHTMLKNDAAVYEDAVIGDGCLLGAHGVIRPKVKLWPGKHIESGSIIAESLVWGERPLKGLFGSSGITGLANLEITPEFAAKLGAAFAANLGSGRGMAVCSDGFPASRLLKRAFTAGALGAGLHVKDLGTAAAPVFRFALGSLGLAGGIYLRLAEGDPHQINLQFMDGRGLPLGRQAERALEQSFFTEDFPRAEADKVGELTYAPGFNEIYLEALGNYVDLPAIRAAGFNIVTSPLQEPAASLLAGMLKLLGGRLVQTDFEGSPPKEPQGRQAFENAKTALLRRMEADHGDLAVGMDHSAEELFLLEPGGQRLNEAQLSTLLSLAELRYGQCRRLPIPVTATAAITELAKAYRGEIIRTKAQRRSLLEEFAAASPAMAGLLMPAYDAMLALARLLEYMAKAGKDIGASLAMLPSYQRVEKAVACTWQDKGAIMRQLIEGSRGRDVELTDGLRVEEEGGWALILPDGEEPVIRVYSEARTAEEADALSRLYTDRINALRPEQGQAPSV